MPEYPMMYPIIWPKAEARGYTIGWLEKRHQEKLAVNQEDKLLVEDENKFIDLIR